MSERIDRTCRVVHLCAIKSEQEGIGARLWSEIADGKLIVAGGHRALSSPLLQAQALSQMLASTTSRQGRLSQEDSQSPPRAQDAHPQEGPRRQDP
jgi:hypothetical protein